MERENHKKHVLKHLDDNPVDRDYTAICKKFPREGKTHEQMYNSVKRVRVRVT